MTLLWIVIVLFILVFGTLSATSAVMDRDCWEQ